MDGRDTGETRKDSRGGAITSVALREELWTAIEGIYGVTIDHPFGTVSPAELSGGSLFWLFTRVRRGAYADLMRLASTVSMMP